MRVNDMVTGETLTGTPSAALIEASEAEGETGAVAAYLDDAGVWQYVQTGDESRMERLGHAVRTVWVD